MCKQESLGIITKRVAKPIQVLVGLNSALAQRRGSGGSEAVGRSQGKSELVQERFRFAGSLLTKNRVQAGGGRRARRFERGASAPSSLIRPAEGAPEGYFILSMFFFYYISLNMYLNFIY
jgi:hypothetical protein